MKRIIALTLTACMVLGSLAGCRSKDPDAEAGGGITRAGWIELLAERYSLDESYSSDPYFTDVSSSHGSFTHIQACAEWDMIDKGGKFEPDRAATVGFAITTAVKAVGLDMIANSENGRALSTDDEIIEFFRSSGGAAFADRSVLNTGLTEAQALEILEVAGGIFASLTLKEEFRIEYKPGAREMAGQEVSLYGDMTGFVHMGSVSVGEIIVVPLCVEYPDGMIVRVTSVDGNSFTYETASLFDAVEDISLRGTFTPEIVGFTMEEGVELVNDDDTPFTLSANSGVSDTPVIQTLAMSGGGGITATPLASVPGNFTIKLKDGIVPGLTGSLKFSKLTFSADIPTIWGFDYNIEVYDPTQVYALHGFYLDYVLSAELALTGKLQTGDAKTGDIKIGEIKLSFKKIVGVTLGVYLTIGAEGKVSVTFGLPVRHGMEFKTGADPKPVFHTGAGSIKSKAEAKAFIYMGPKASIAFVGGIVKIGELGSKTGIEILAKPNEYLCLDVTTYMPLNLSAKLDFKIAEKTIAAGWSWEKKIWTEKHSPRKESYHIEDWEIVPECTVGSGLSILVLDDETRYTIAGASVWLRSAADVARPFEDNSNTDEVGFVRYRNIVPGDYKAEVSAPGYKTKVTHITLEEIKDEITFYTIMLEKDEDEPPPPSIRIDEDIIYEDSGEDMYYLHINFYSAETGQLLDDLFYYNIVTLTNVENGIEITDYMDEFFGYKEEYGDFRWSVGSHNPGVLHDGTYSIVFSNFWTVPIQFLIIVVLEGQEIMLEFTALPSKRAIRNVYISDLLP
jgi:hypothetical protein